MLTSAKSILAVLVALAVFGQDVEAGRGMSRRRYVPGRAGLQTAQKTRRFVPPIVRSVDSDQSSLTLNPNQIGPNLADDGQNPPVAGQDPSQTSTNNYINFCETQNVPLTNGTQIKTGSCNQTPMGRIIASAKMPSCKFAFPTNGLALKTNSTFTIKLNLKNLNAGHFTNPTVTYYANPQTVDDSGTVIGHTHVTVESIASYTDTSLPVPTNFAFFKGVDGGADANGQVTVDVAGGLPAGFYKLSSINTAATHQPVLVAQAQHGGLDDSVFFEVNDEGVATFDIDTGKPIAANGKGAANGKNGKAAADAAATESASSVASSASASVSDSVSVSDVATGTASVAATATDSVASDSSSSLAATETGKANGKNAGKNGGKNNNKGANGTNAAASISSAATVATESASVASSDTAAATSSSSAVESSAAVSSASDVSSSVSETASSSAEAAAATDDAKADGKGGNKSGNGRGGRGRRSSWFW